MDKQNKIKELAEYHKPTDYSEYLGIELEFNLILDNRKFREKLIERLPEKILNKVKLNTTGSCMPTDGIKILPRSNPLLFFHELRILVKIKDFNEVISPIIEAVRDMGASTPDRHGLHIHLDCRKRNWKDVFTRFFKEQENLFSLCHTFRETYGMCGKITENTFKELMSREYGTPKTQSIHHHSGFNTMEIRMHEATLDVVKIKNWVNTLLKVGGYV